VTLTHNNSVSKNFVHTTLPPVNTDRKLYKAQSQRYSISLVPPGNNTFQPLEDRNASQIHVHHSSHHLYCKVYDMTIKLEGMWNQVSESS